MTVNDQERSIPQVEIRPSPISGRGVFALRAFKRGETVLRWDLSRLISPEQLQTLPAEELHFVCRYDEGRFLINQPPARFVNHSCEPNLRTENFRDIALRDIAAGEELTSDYTAETDGSAVAFSCNCGAPNCKSSVPKSVL